jgi:Domain of unknown function (DUF4350)
MQIKLDKSDRRLLLWTGLVVGALVTVLVWNADNEQDSGVPTTYSSTSSGAKAAYLYLKEEGYNVERWEDPPQELPTDAQGTVLVLASPGGVLSPADKSTLEMYVARGGKILGTGLSCSWFLPKANIVFEFLPGAVWKDYQPQILSPLARAGTIRMSPEAHWGDPEGSQLVHYAHDGKGIVVSYRIGKGEVIWWAANQPLSNAGISQAGNLSLLLNSLGGSRSVRILWDEYFHSTHLGSSGSIWLAPLKVGFWQCMAVFAVLVLAFGRRNAPIRPLSEPSRLSPLEFVHTLGNLYRRAHSTRTALEVPYNRFRALLIRRLGLRHDVSSSELLESARKKLGYRDVDFEDTIRQILNDVQNPDLKEGEVLELVQRLNQHARNLKLISLKQEE